MSVFVSVCSVCVCMFLDSRDKSSNILKTLSQRSKKMKEQKNKGIVLAAESAYNFQNAQFGLLMTGSNRDENQLFLG